MPAYRTILLIFIVLVCQKTHAYPDVDRKHNSNDQNEHTLYSNPYHIIFFNPNYLLVDHYSEKPVHPSLIDQNKLHRSVHPSEVMFQLSLRAPIMCDIFHTSNSINLAYTQRSFWQAYAESAYFRESNYQPEIFWKNYSLRHFEFFAGLSHESNGRGGDEERSWNRAYVDIRYKTRNMLISVKPWTLILKEHSSNIHNPNIANYLGYGRILVAINFYNIALSVQVRNAIESGFRRGATEAQLSFPLTRRIRVFAKTFSGYGQNLIEYDHYTNSAGIGIGLSDWLIR